MPANECADRLKEARKALKMLQKDFGVPLELNEDKVTNLETGRIRLTAELAAQIEKAHGINMRWLIAGEGEMLVGDAPVNKCALSGSAADLAARYDALSEDGRALVRAALISAEDRYKTN